MASMGGGHLSPEQLVLRVREGKLLNSQLKAICSAEGLRSTGVKQELQTRIIDHVRSTSRANDNPRYERLTALILDPSSIAQRPYPGSSYSSSPAAASPAGPRSMGSYGAHPVVFGGGNRITFKQSPFYDIQAQIGNTKTLEVMKEHRHTISIVVRPDDNPLLNTVATDKSLRIMVFCTGDGQSNPRDISFPHNSEIKVNGGEVKANLRGLKGKSGSTRPVDITDSLRLRPSHYANSVDLTYALSDKERNTKFHKKFFFMIHVVKKIPVEDLVTKLSTGKKMSKAQVLAEMLKAQDSEIQATSMGLSLKCPLSTLRISLPCRSTACVTHNTCFDATSYLQLQEQGPTWVCPICNKAAPFENLFVDEYVQDILSKTSKSTDQITVQPNGEWSQNGKSESPSNVNGFSDDDDLVEIRDTRLEAVKQQIGTPQSSTISRTPPGSSREASASITASLRGNISGKRPAAEVIDLTFSDEEDEEPVRPQKRQFTGHQPPQNMFAHRNI